MNLETTPPVTGIVDEILAELPPLFFISEQQIPLLGKSPYFAHRKEKEGLFQAGVCLVSNAQSLLEAKQKELASIEAMVRMLEENEWAEHVGMLGGPIARRLETEITRMHNEQQALIAQQGAPVAVPDDLRVKAENFVARMRKGAEGDRAAERELEDEDADEAQACAVQAYIQEDAAAMVEQLLAAAPTPPAQQPVAVPDGWRVIPYSGSWKRGAEQWEVYSPNGSGGIVDSNEILNREVAGLLDALAAAPTPPVQQSQWVPVSVRLPEDEAQVICSGWAFDDPKKGRFVTPAVFILGEFWPFFDDDDAKAAIMDDNPLFTPTHWMPLPSAPGNTAAPEQAEQPTVTVPQELLECYLNGGGDWVEAGHKLRALLGGGTK